MSSSKYKNLLEKLVNNLDLTFLESEFIATEMLTGKLTEAQIAGILIGLNSKGESTNEIAGFAKALRSLANKVTPKSQNIIDTCGTGGDGSSSFNISTTAAFVLAGGGVKVAKHGNSSISSQCGSADVLKELGVNIKSTNSEIVKQIDEIGISFLFAPSVHPSMKNVMKTRISLGIPTIFNMIGPLCNPVDLHGQVIGVYEKSLVPKIAGALIKLGIKNGVVLHGHGKVDELSLSGPNYINIVEGNKIIELTIDAKNYGLSSSSKEELLGGNLKENAAIMLAILNGNDCGPKRDVVILNAAIGFIIANKTSKIEDALILAKESLSSGNAKEKLDLLIARTNIIS